MMTDINWFEELFLSTEMWGYFGPLALVVIGWYLAKKESWLGVIMFVVDCLVAYQYFDLLDATPEYWWHIIILLLGGIFGCVLSLLD